MENTERQNALIDYIRNHDGESPESVFEGVQNIINMSRQTFFRYLGNLKERNIVLSKNRNKRDKSLHINYKNEYNKFVQELSNIECRMNLWDRFNKNGKYIRANRNNYLQFYNKFSLYHYKSNLIIFLILLRESNKIVLSEKYSKLLNNRIVELISRLNKQNDWISMEYELEFLLNNLKSFYDNANIQKDSANTEVVNELITSIENFKSKFSETH